MQAPPLWLGGLSPFPSALGEPICHPKQRWLSQSVQEGGIQSGRASSNVLATHVAAGWGGVVGLTLGDLSRGQWPGALTHGCHQAQLVSLCVRQDLASDTSRTGCSSCLLPSCC